jgi:Reverse transcriptase (RNA-dependent DNA polymerase)/Endonuclease-reverse transcriptase
MLRRLGLFNARGLGGKDHDVLDFFASQKLSMLALTETHLAPGNGALLPSNLIYADIRRENRNVIRGGRRSGGGIMILLDQRYHSITKTLYTDPNKHFIIMELLNTIITVAYLPPSLDDSYVNTVIDKTLEHANTNPIILLGDFNSRMGNITNDTLTNSRGRIFSELLEDTNFDINIPDEGCFTSFSLRQVGAQGVGAGVTDLIITRDIAVTNFIVHSNNNLGGSDHRPLTCEIPLKQPPPLRKYCRWNIRKLQDDIIAQEYLDLLEETEPTHLDPNDAENSWKIVKSWINVAAYSTIGKLQVNYKAGRTFYTEKLNRKRQQLKDSLEDFTKVHTNKRLPLIVRQAAGIKAAKINEEYLKLVKERKLEMFQTMAEKMGSKDNINALFKMASCRKARCNRRPTGLSFDNIETYREHFLDTIGKEPIGTRSTTVPDINSLELTPETIDESEIKTAIQSLPNGKAAGPDGNMGELLKQGGDPMVRVITQLLNVVHNSATIPNDWKNAWIHPIFKQKGSPTVISNYRPISLTCVTRRVYERILLNRMKHLELNLQNTQGGFRKSRSTLQQVFALQEIMQKHPHAWHSFLDIKAAYDTVNRNILWQMLSDRYNLNPSTIRRLRALFDYNTSYLLLPGGTSSPFPNKRGLLQGSTLSPLLFNLFLDELLVRLNRLPTIITFGYRSNNLVFADDISLHAKTIVIIQTLLNECAEWSIQVGLEFSTTKSNVLANDRQGRCTLYNEPLPIVKEATYLGIPVKSDGLNLQKNSRVREAKARQVTKLLQNIGYNGTGFPQVASIRLFKAFVRPTLTYGTELRPQTSEEIRPLVRAQNHAIRTMFSSQRNTSIRALQKLAHILPFASWANILNIKFATRLHNSTDITIPAVHLWWNGLQSATGLSGINYTITKNPLWTKAIKLSHLHNKLSREPQLEVIPGFPTELVKQIEQQFLIDNTESTSNVASAIHITPTDPLRPCLSPSSFSSPDNRAAHLRWITGQIAIHTPCVKCHIPISRTHAIICSGAKNLLLARYEFISSENEIDNIVPDSVEEIMNVSQQYTWNNESQHINYNAMNNASIMNYYINDDSIQNASNNDEAQSFNNTTSMQHTPVLIMNTKDTTRSLQNTVYQDTTNKYNTNSNQVPEYSSNDNHDPITSLSETHNTINQATPHSTTRHSKHFHITPGNTVSPNAHIMIQETTPNSPNRAIHALTSSNRQRIPLIMNNAKKTASPQHDDYIYHTKRTSQINDCSKKTLTKRIYKDTKGQTPNLKSFIDKINTKSKVKDKEAESPKNNMNTNISTLLNNTNYFETNGDDVENNKSTDKRPAPSEDETPNQTHIPASATLQTKRSNFGVDTPRIDGVPLCTEYLEEEKEQRNIPNHKQSIQFIQSKNHIQSSSISNSLSEYLQLSKFKYNLQIHVPTLNLPKHLLNQTLNTESKAK